MKTTRAFLILLSLVLWTSTLADAQEWTIGFNLGTADLESGDPTNLEFRADVRGGYAFNPRWGIEAELIRANAVLDATLDAFFVNGIFELRPNGTFAPYVLAGVGVARLEDVPFLSNRSSVSSDGPAFQAAIGARRYFGEERRIGIRGEISTMREETDIFADGRHTSITIGMIWRFEK